MTALRANFALPGGRFPLNTPGRRKIAPELAAYSERKGNISKAQEQMVVRKAREKRTPVAKVDSKKPNMDKPSAIKKPLAPFVSTKPSDAPMAMAKMKAAKAMKPVPMTMPKMPMFNPRPTSKPMGKTVRRPKTGLK